MDTKTKKTAALAHPLWKGGCLFLLENPWGPKAGLTWGQTRAAAAWQGSEQVPVLPKGQGPSAPWNLGPFLGRLPHLPCPPPLQNGPVQLRWDNSDSSRELSSERTRLSFQDTRVLGSKGPGALDGKRVGSTWVSILGTKDPHCCPPH